MLPRRRDKETAGTIRDFFTRSRTYVAGSGLGPLFVRAVAGSGLVRMAAMVASFLVGIQLARLLGVEGYGYYGLALAILTIAAIPAELGLSKLVTREVATATAATNPSGLFAVLRWADRTCVRISAATVTAVLVAALILMDSRPVLAQALLLGAPIMPLLALARIRGGALQGLQHIVRGQIPANLLRAVFVSAFLALVSLAGIGIDPSRAMLLNSVTAAMVLLIAHLWLRNRLPPRADPSDAPINGRRLLASTIPFALTDGIRILQLEISVLLLGILAAPAEVGLFRVAVITAGMAAAPLAVLTRATMPLIARLHAESQSQRLQKILRYSAFAQTAGVVLLSLPLLLVPELLLSIVFGPEYSRAANALRIVAVGQIINGAFGLTAQLLNMTHNEKRVTRAMAIGLALNVCAVLVLGRIWGIVGAALGFTVALICWNVLAWLDARRLLGLETSVLPVRVKAAKC